MKKTQGTIFIAIGLLLLSISMSMDYGIAANQNDSAAIRQSALDYIEGYYSGDVARMEKAIHPDFNKATPRDLPQTGRTTLAYTTYSGLIEFTRAKTGALDDTARKIQVNALDIENDVANVKVISANFIDYLQLLKIDDQWKIVNVLFTSGTAVPPRLKDFDPKKENGAIEQCALDYMLGITATDAARLEITLSSDFNKITLNPVAATGKTSLRRQRYASMIENALARIGKQDETYRNNQVSVLDAVDGLAVVRCDMAGTYEYLQMYKSGGQWKIFNSISKPNANLSFEQAMTVIAGHPMPDFSLPVYGGGEFTLSKYRGKNVLLIFPRGRVGRNWCSYCPYQYLELEQLQKKSNIKSKYDVEIAFVLPYGSNNVKEWMEKFPDALTTVENLKNPKVPPAPGTIQADYSKWVKENFPLKFDVKKDDVHNVIPVLVDENRTLSRQLKIFTSFWDNVSSEQNMASVFIIDKNGILKLKYIGQMTEDRPSVEYLLDFIKRMK